MDITLIGAGRLAVNLGQALHDAGHNVVQVFSRTMESAQYLAGMVGGEPVTDPSCLGYGSDVYIFSVKDSALSALIPQICSGRERSLFVHTAGSVAIDVFSGVASHYGVLYPMQTFSKERRVDFSEIPCFIEGNDERSLKTIGELAASVSGKVVELSSADRKYLHLSAVFACNFVNHCYALSADILNKHGMSFDVMLPLIDETARKVHAMSPADAQTGPALRYDENVISAHCRLLDDNPLVKDIYERMSASIHHKAASND